MNTLLRIVNSRVQKNNGKFDTALLSILASTYRFRVLLRLLLSVLILRSLYAILRLSAPLLQQPVRGRILFELASALQTQSLVLRFLRRSLVVDGVESKTNLSTVLQS